MGEPTPLSPLHELRDTFCDHHRLISSHHNIIIIFLSRCHLVILSLPSCHLIVAILSPYRIVIVVIVAGTPCLRLLPLPLCPTTSPLLSAGPLSAPPPIAAVGVVAAWGDSRACSITVTPSSRPRYHLHHITCSTLSFIVLL